LLQDTVQRSPRDEETQKQLEFVTRALGRLDSAELVLPALFAAMERDADPVLHKDSLTAVTMIAGRAYERQAPLDDPALVQRLIAVSESADVLSRHQAAFALGLTPTPEARARLQVLLQDGDLMTRANAAIGLARQDSVEGLPVFEEVFADLAARPLNPAGATTDTDAQHYFERYVLYSNCLKAVDLLQPRLAPDVRRRLASVLETVADTTGDARIKVDTRQTLYKLSGR
jgi:HEAT repeat protein